MNLQSSELETDFDIGPSHVDNPENFPHFNRPNFTEIPHHLYDASEDEESIRASLREPDERTFANYRDAYEAGIDSDLDAQEELQQLAPENQSIFQKIKILFSKLNIFKWFGKKEKGPEDKPEYIENLEDTIEHTQEHR